MRHLKHTFAAFVLVTLAACAGFFLKPETFNEEMAAGAVLVTSARATASELLNSHQIGSKDARNVQGDADLGREGLEIAQEIQAVDPAAADAKLRQTMIGLRAIDAYLKSRKNAPPLPAPGAQP